MAKTKIKEYRSRIIELEKKIYKYEKAIFNIKDFIEKLDRAYGRGRITYEEHQEIINKQFKDISPNDLITNYKNQIEYCKSSIRFNEKYIDYEKERERRSNNNKLIAVAVIFTLLITSSIIINVVQQNRVLKSPQVEITKETFIDNLNIITNRTIEYNWSPKNKGSLVSVKISGSIKGSGQIKISLDNKTILDSTITKLNSLTGLAIINLNTTKDNLTETKEEPQNTTQEVNKTNSELNISKKQEVEKVKSNITEISNITGVKETKELDFKNVCLETCELPELNQDSYTIKVETENATVKILTIEYTIIKKKVQQIEEVDLTEALRKLNQRFPGFTFKELTQDSQGYNVKIEFSSSNKEGYAFITGISSLSDIKQIEIKEDPKFATDIFAINSFKMNNATITLTKTKPVTGILTCPNWDFNEKSCPSWQQTNISTKETKNLITFTVKSFSGWVGTSFIYDDFQDDSGPDNNYCIGPNPGNVWGGSICTADMGSSFLLETDSLCFMDEQSRTDSNANKICGNVTSRGLGTSEQTEVYELFGGSPKSSINSRVYFMVDCNNPINVPDNPPPASQNFWNLMQFGTFQPVPSATTLLGFAFNEMLACGGYDISNPGLIKGCQGQTMQQITCGQWHYAEMHYDSTTNNLTCYLDGTMFCSEEGVTQFNKEVTAIDLGVGLGSLNTVSGTIYLDEYKSSDKYIGGYPTLSNFNILSDPIDENTDQQFGATVIDNDGDLDTVYIEIDGTNYTATNSVGDDYSFDYSSTNYNGGDTVSYIWWANDSNGQTVRSEQFSFTVTSSAGTPPDIKRVELKDASSTDWQLCNSPGTCYLTPRVHSNVTDFQARINTFDPDADCDTSGQHKAILYLCLLEPLDPTECNKETANYTFTMDTIVTNSTGTECNFTLSPTTTGTPEFFIPAAEYKLNATVTDQDGQFDPDPESEARWTYNDLVAIGITLDNVEVSSLLLGDSVIENEEWNIGTNEYNVSNWGNKILDLSWRITNPTNTLNPNQFWDLLLYPNRFVLDDKADPYPSLDTGIKSVNLTTTDSQFVYGNGLQTCISFYCNNSINETLSTHWHIKPPVLPEGTYTTDVTYTATVHQ